MAMMKMLFPTRYLVARRRGILQEPVQMDFGHTFVASDPDGHRLRVFVPGAA